MSRTVTVLVCGISGVGKTRLISKVLDRFPDALTWRAGEIVGDARKTFDAERLRTLPSSEIARSQELLVDGFARRAGLKAGHTVILDAHAVLDTDEGLYDIPVDVICRLAPSCLVHVEDDVAQIASRRQADASRQRPRRTWEQLGEYQERSIRVCTEFASVLGISLSRIRSGDESSLAAAISSVSHVG